MVRWNWLVGAALAVGLVAGSQETQGQGQQPPRQAPPVSEELPPGNQARNPGAGPRAGAGCPMIEANQATQDALQAGAAITLENTERGALIRIEAPMGEDEAILAAQTAAQQLASVAQQDPATACPMMEQRPQRGRRGPGR